MPELPEVENVRLSLNKKILNKKITGVRYHNTIPIKYNTTDEFTGLTQDRYITMIERFGKFLVLTLKPHKEPVINLEVQDEPDTTYLICHLGMTGAFLYTDQQGNYTGNPDSITNHIHVSIDFEDNTELYYSDYRRFGSLRVIDFDTSVTPNYPSHLKTLFTLGVDAVSKEETAEIEFVNAVRKPKYYYKPIKQVLLDQTVVAGVGNIYASECLFPNSINPYTPVALVTNEQLKDIFRTNRDIMELSITLGGSSIRDYVDGDGTSGTFQDHLKVYNQTECSVCGSYIEKTVLDKRATFHCPECQPEIDIDALYN